MFRGSASVHLRAAKIVWHHSHGEEDVHGTPRFSETRLWFCRGRRRAGRKRTGSTAYAASARRGRIAAAVERGCPSRCHPRGRGGTSEAGRGALGLASPPLAPSLAQAPSLASSLLAPPALGLAPSALASPLLAPPLLVRRCGPPRCLGRSEAAASRRMLRGCVRSD